MLFYQSTDLETAGNRWIIDSRNRHRPHGLPLDDHTRRYLQPFFSKKTLDQIRIRTIPRIADPPFPKEHLHGAGLSIDFRFAAGITFIDTVVLAEQIIGQIDRTALIFHEAVHVAQYRFLGRERFIRKYLRDWITHQKAYHRIPIEAQAYRLQRRFETGTRPFSVEDDIFRRFSNI